MDRRVVFGTVVVALAMAGPVLAGFGAADLIYIPVVSHITGASGSMWATDLYITNPEEVAIDVAIGYIPSGLAANSFIFSSRETWLGGREDDEFGLIDESLAGIPPGGAVVIRDIVGEYWFDQLGLIGNGSLVIFAYEADTLEPDSTRVLRNAIANARIYNDTTIWVEDDENPDEFVERAAQFAQVMPGVPWYNLADAAAVSETEDFSYQLLTGAEEGGLLRFNVGMVNASDALTSITVSVQPFQANGEPFLDADENEIRSLVTMPPVSHVQYFRPFTVDWDLEEVDIATVKVAIEAWSSTAAEPVVMMTSYGSVIHNRTNDPSTVLPSFAHPYDVDCIWGGDGETKVARPDRRPVEIPLGR
ncbi:MAG TPA: hypothetical protein VLB51_08880 [Methylomirabilota bacterium]|nr:hypothetical protein [Methylomirabilota bacterium]